MKSEIVRRNGEEVLIREATEADIHYFYGGAIEWRIQAWVAEYRGIVSAISGIRFSDTAMVAFSDWNEHAQSAPPVLRFVASKALMQKIVDTGLAVITVCFSDEKGSKEYNKKKARFLELMGFEHSHWDDISECAVFRLRS